MAAKQGLSAQISQASEDAKRAVLSRTSLQTSLWFSNLNTTCTIKSAPPRTPEVLSLLSTKSGWLFKRNEQHVWQTRWCCVVPHTFLYYFDANVLPGDAQPPVPPATLQDEWNSAVLKGYPHRGRRAKANAPRSSLYFMGGGGGGGGGGANGDDDDGAVSPCHTQNTLPNNNNGSVLPPGGAGTTPEAFATMQPAGIIDLECYTSVHRSAQNQLVLELAGDDAVNPDLRQFYFTAGSESETETWTQALLGQRHTALMDETEAYKQVCDGFAQQLQALHTELDGAHKQASDAQEELYAVRSEMEDGRRSCWKLVEDVLDRHQQQQQQQQQQPSKDGLNTTTLPSPSSTFRADLNAIRSQDMTLLAPVQLLSDYTRVLEDSCQELQTTNTSLQQRLNQSVTSDHDQVAQLQQQLADLQAEFQQQSSQWEHEKQVLTQTVQTSQKDVEDLNKDLASTRMEITMYQSSTRNKITELQNHKKILKKEVLDLRQKLENAQSELTLVQHKEKSHRLEVGQERKKAELLERYVDKMESQVKVQQNMMEMMSASGVGSLYGGPGQNGGAGGGGGGSHYEVTVPHTVHSPRSTGSHGLHNNTNNNSNNSVNPEVEAAMAASIHGSHTVNLPTDAAAAELQLPSMTPNGNNTNNGKKQVVEGLHRLPSPLSRRNLDDDNKSHMSELTEDRTQRQFDAIHYLRTERERERNLRYAGPNNINTPLTPSPQQPGRTPPTYILGGSHNSDTGAPAGVGNGTSRSGQYSQQQNQQQLLQNFQNPDSAKLGTIHSNATAATTPNHLSSRSVSGGSPQQHLPHNTNLHHHHGATSSGQSVGSGMSGKLSVAQRARLLADQAGGSTPVRVRLDEERQKLEKPSPGPPVTSPGRNRRMQRTPSASSRSTNGGFFSNIGRKLEAAIDKSVFSVEVPHSDDDEDDEDLSSSASYSRGADDPIENERYRSDNEEDDRDQNPAASRRAPALLTKETLDGHNSQHHELLSRSASSPTRNKSSRHSAVSGYDDAVSSVVSDEKKTATTPDRNRLTPMTLAERQALQRANQVKYLKDRGVIKDETEVKGGAGSASPSFNDTGSVASTNVSGSAISFRRVSSTPQRR